MKLIITIIGLMVAFTATADPTNGIGSVTDNTNQQNSSYNSPSSAMSNVQINPYSNARDYYGEGVSCSKPAINIGLAGGQSPHRTMAYANLNIPLGGKGCKRVAKLREQTVAYQLYQAQTEQRKADVLFAAKMANMCLEIASQVTITQDNPLFEECVQYVAIEPTADAVAELTYIINQRDLFTNDLDKRLRVVEGVAHLPNKPTLLWHNQSPTLPPQ